MKSLILKDHQVLLLSSLVQNQTECKSNTSPVALVGKPPLQGFMVIDLNARFECQKNHRAKRLTVGAYNSFPITEPTRHPKIPVHGDRGQQRRGKVRGKAREGAITENGFNPPGPSRRLVHDSFALFPEWPEGSRTPRAAHLRSLCPVPSCWVSTCLQ